MDLILILKSSYELLKEKKPKLICLPNPNSPTGTLLDKKILMI